MHNSLIDFSPQERIEAAFGIADLVDIDQLKNLFELFTQATGFTIGFLDHPGMNVLIATGWKRICTDFHRSCPAGEMECFISNQQLLNHLENADQAVVQMCNHGLVDCAVPIVVDGRHLASLATGQILLQEPDLKRFTHQAEKFGFVTADYLQAVAEVRVVDEQKLKDVTSYLGAMAQMISQMGYAKLKLKNEMAQRKHNEAVLRIAATAFESHEGMLIADASKMIMRVNKSFINITGYSAEDAVGQNPRILASGRHDRSFYDAMSQALDGKGVWSGEIWNRRKNGQVYPEWLTISVVKDDTGVVSHYVAIFRDITEHFNAQAQIETMAFYDPLTNLPNRVLLAERLQQAMALAQRRSQQLAVVYLDLDGFKNINEHHGHEVGDHLLIALSTAMKGTLCEGDTLARIGGDEFVAVLNDLQNISNSLPMLNRLLRAAASPVKVGELTLQCSASLGVTFYSQDQDIDADQLLRQADQAMYQAKVAGKNRYHIFDAAQDSTIRGHHESLKRIRLALTHDEFVLHYQPKVNMRSGQVIGAEALIRWQHPEKGLLSPAEFLPIIEEHPLAVEIGEWVIDTTLTQMTIWQAQGLDMQQVSVNVGARQLQHGDFVERLKFILDKHPQVNPANLQIEVLETSALSDMVQVSQVIEDCARLGVTFALDDFGTGYSSLTYLKRLHVAALKIDQSFVRGMLEDQDDLAILQGVIGLATAFKRQVIAEGVESVAHGTALLQLGCEFAQGYGIARPMPGANLPAWAASWVPDAAWSQE